MWVWNNEIILKEMFTRGDEKCGLLWLRDLSWKHKQNLFYLVGRDVQYFVISGQSGQSVTSSFPDLGWPNKMKLGHFCFHIQFCKLILSFFLYFFLSFLLHIFFVFLDISCIIFFSIIILFFTFFFLYSFYSFFFSLSSFKILSSCVIPFFCNLFLVNYTIFSSVFFSFSSFLQSFRNSWSSFIISLSSLHFPQIDIYLINLLLKPVERKTPGRSDWDILLSDAVRLH